MSLPVVETTARIELIPSGLAVDARQLERAVANGVDGLVLAASGIGNTTPEIGDAIADVIDADVPVVVSTRCFDGAVAARYGGPGGSRTIREHGTIPAGDLPPWKGRIKLGLALSAYNKLENVRTVFENQYGAMTKE